MISLTVRLGCLWYDLPKHLKDLYSRSREGLNAGQQRRLLKLLLQFQDIFSKRPQDLGKTGLAKHEINTGDAVPVRQHPRRLPLAQREEAFKAVEDMQKPGIIDPQSVPGPHLSCWSRKRMARRGFAWTTTN